MKPDWKDAPEWANYLAMDRDGQWFWYEERPNKEDDCFVCATSLTKSKIVYFKDWENTLEKRP